MEEIVELEDTIIEDKNLKDGLGNLATILGGLALTATNKKKMVESVKTPKALKVALTSLGLTAASIVGIGAAIAKFVEKHSPKD